jgi:hypothetical protein
MALELSTERALQVDEASTDLQTRKESEQSDYWGLFKVEDSVCWLPSIGDHRGENCVEGKVVIFG